MPINLSTGIERSAQELKRQNVIYVERSVINHKILFNTRNPARTQHLEPVQNVKKSLLGQQ